MRYFLMLDYDGTLTPIVHHPRLAVLSPGRRTLLRELSHRPEIKLAIISGRRLSDVKKRVGIPELVYVGNHGFEIDTGGKKMILPAARHFMPRLKMIKNSLRAALNIRGVFIEDKGPTVSVHFRAVPVRNLGTFKKEFYRALAPYRGKFRLTHGKKVFEIHPPVDWNKGKAIKWIIKELGLRRHLPIYIGDDRTDEDAFRELGGRGLTIHVGPGRTAAKKRIKNVREVYHFLKGLTGNEN